MPSSLISVLRWQFDLTWSLFDIHLSELSDADCRWEPAAVSWTVRQHDDGVWRADFAEQEPDPVPAVTAAWVTWHIGWWWSSALAVVNGGTPKAPDEVAWPGSAAATVGWLRSMREEWIAYLDGLTEDDLEVVAAFPWHTNEDLTIAHMVGWVNAELMKNAAEVGQLRLQRTAS